MNILPRSPARSTRNLHSPRTLLKNNINNNKQVEGQYQLKTGRHLKKPQNNYSRPEDSTGDTVKQKSSIRRRLSVKKLLGQESKLSQKTSSKPSIIQAHQDKPKQAKTTVELALQLEYNQPSRQHLKKVQSKPEQQVAQPTEEVKKRIRRIRSTQSLLKNKREAQELTFKCNMAKAENNKLKAQKESVEEKLCSLQNTFASQKIQFQGQIVAYQRQVQAMRRRIGRNKNQLGHIYSYKSFDPVNLLVHPIVEMDGECSQVRSVLNSQIEEMQFESRILKGRLCEKDNKEELTQTTGAASREEYGQIDCY